MAKRPTSIIVAVALAHVSCAVAQTPRPPRRRRIRRQWSRRRARTSASCARELEGATRSFAGPGGKTVELFVPDAARTRDTVNLVIHFHGAAWLPHQAAAQLGSPTAAAVVNLGAGSGLYHHTFADPAVFDSLLVARRT